MPAIGAYPSNSSLWDTLVSECDVMTNISILTDLLVQPLFNIKEDFNKGMNPYICRERYRQWVERAREHVGTIDIPDWNMLMDMDEERWLFDYIEFLGAGTDHEWEVFFDENVPMHKALEKTWLNHTAEDFIEILLSVSPPDALIIYSASQFGAFYVVRSPDIANRGQVGWSSYHSYHAMEDIADPAEEGDILTYVLPKELIQLWQKAERELKPEWSEYKEDVG